MATSSVRLPTSARAPAGRQPDHISSVRLQPDAVMCRASRVLVVVGTIAIVLAADTAFAQCAMCRRALQSPEGQQMIAAFRSGILFLLAAPFTVFGIVATMAVRAHRRRFSGAGDVADSRAGPDFR